MAPISRSTKGCDSGVEHATKGDTVDIASMYTKSDDAPSELVHGHEYPVAIQKDGVPPTERSPASPWGDEPAVAGVSLWTPRPVSRVVTAGIPSDAPQGEDVFAPLCPHQGIHCPLFLSR